MEPDPGSHPLVLEISRDFKPDNRRALRRVLARRTREANRDRFPALVVG
jgi:hypothetical protein